MANEKTPDNDKALRKHLLDVLSGGNAHLDFDAAIKDFSADLRGIRPKGSLHSPWEILEHMHLAQWDILEFTRNPKHVSPDFPSGYWPTTPEPPNNRAWNKSADAFRVSEHSQRTTLEHILFAHRILH